MIGGEIKTSFFFFLLACQLGGSMYDILFGKYSKLPSPVLKKIKKSESA